MPWVLFIFKIGCLVSLLIENGVLASQVVYEDSVPVLRSALEYLPRYLPTWSHTFHGSWCRHGWEPIYYLQYLHMPGVGWSGWWLDTLYLYTDIIVCSGTFLP